MATLAWNPEALHFHTKNTFLHFTESMREASSFESPRDRTRERRSFSDITNGGPPLIPISPLLTAATSPGLPPSVLAIDEAAHQRHRWAEFSSKVEDVDESPLALSPDAAARHLPDFFNDDSIDDDTQVDSAHDKFDSGVPPMTPSPLLHAALHPQRFHENFFAGGEACGWELGAPLCGENAELFSVWQGNHDTASWEAIQTEVRKQTEEAWGLTEASYQNGYWDPAGAGAGGYSGWDMLWNETTCNDYRADASLWEDAWGEGEIDTDTRNGTKQDGLDTPEKTGKQKGQEITDLLQMGQNKMPKKVATPGLTPYSKVGHGGPVAECLDARIPTQEQDGASMIDKVSDDIRPSELAGTETTVMLRNIPNKFMPEALAKQLSQDYKGMFDFMYLPIDFKNKCNVGYGFINFRTPELCTKFFVNFNGVEVRKCLPGFNSRKVVEVTPARIQGFQENVRRLRNSPVMSQLQDNPEWLPLLFDEDGKHMLFPEPDQPLAPVRPRGGRHKDVQK